MKTVSDAVRAYFRAYEEKDRGAVEALLGEDFTFTSPLDDRISREHYFERCWPNSDVIEGVHIEKLFAQGDEAFVQYELRSKGQAPLRNTEFFAFRGGRISHIDVYFGAESGSGAAKGGEEAVRAVIEDWAEGIRRKDVPRVLRHFERDSVRFYLAPPLQTEQPLRENLEGWFATFRGDIGYEMRDLSITTSADLAYVHSLNHLVGTKVDGEPADVWFRETMCLRRIDDEWRITHEHESVPFYMDGTKRAAVDLRPS